jgi:hypothetical protein
VRFTSSERAKNDCSKSEIRLGSHREESCAAQWLSVLSEEPRSGKTQENISAFIPRNPLIRLDSDEEIQGNPKYSNLPEAGFWQRKRRNPR